MTKARWSPALARSSLALYVVFEEPLAMVSDAPSAYANQPSFQFIKDVPTTWDATQVLNGTPGEFVTIARQHGNEWYLGSLTNWTARDLRVPLSFLGNGKYEAEIYEDAADAEQNPKNVSIRKQSVQGSRYAHVAFSRWRWLRDSICAGRLNREFEHCSPSTTLRRLLGRSQDQKHAQKHKPGPEKHTAAHWFTRKKVPDSHGDNWIDIRIA